MAEIIIMPKLGFNMSVGKLVTWYKSEGDPVKKGDPVFAIETDKTSIDIEATQDGIFRKKFIEEGDSIEVTLPIAIVGGADENIDYLISEANRQLKRESEETESVLAPQGKKGKEISIEERTSSKADGKLKITPRAQRIAMEKKMQLTMLENIVGTGWNGGVCEKDILTYENSSLKIVKATPVAKKIAITEGIDLADVSGSGSGGKIMKTDVDKLRMPTNIGGNSLKENRSTLNEREILETIPYSGIRKIIGDRLSKSKQEAPHIYFTQKVNLEKLMEMRRQVNEAQEQKISITDFISMAVIKALKKYPDLNSALIDGNIIKYKTINLGIAVAAPGGLIVPCIKHADKMGVKDVSEVSALLIQKARNGKLSVEDYSGGTFTISNLGMFGIDNFTAIINPPEVAILAVSATKNEPCVTSKSDGTREVSVKPMMNITLSTDHRVVDGLLSAQFVTEVKNMLEHPIGLLV